MGVPIPPSCPHCGAPTEGHPGCRHCGHLTLFPPQPAPPRAISTKSPKAIALAIGGVLLIVGAALPWISASTALISVSKSGLDGTDGFVTAGAGIVILAMAYLHATRRDADHRPLIVGVTVAILALAIMALVEFPDLDRRVKDLQAGSNIVAGIGFGVWVTFAGCLAAMASGMIADTVE